MKKFIGSNSLSDWNALARPDRSDFEIADCASSRSHDLRLKALLRLPILANDRVLDFGCGTGRLSDLLPAGVKYSGLDWSEAIVREARKRRPGVEFSVGDGSEMYPAEWLVSSGVFNVSDGWSKELTASMIDRMCRMSSRGIGVTVRCRPEKGRLHYTPQEMLEYIAGYRWANVHVDNVYLEHDLCLTAWRDVKA